MSPGKKNTKKRSQKIKDIKGIALSTAALIFLFGFLGINIGQAGESFIYTLYEAIGYLSYAIPIFLLWWAAGEFMHKELPFKYTFLWGFIALLTGGSVFLHLAAPGPYGGGVVGNFLTGAVFQIAVGTVGSYLISLALIVTAVILLADISVRSLLSAVFSALSAFFKMLWRNLKYLFSLIATKLKFSKTKKQKIKTSKRKKKRHKKTKEKTKKEEKKPEDKKTKSKAISSSATLPEQKKDKAGYKIPLSILKKPQPHSVKITEEEERGQSLIEVLRNFNIDAEISAVETGPSITRYEIEIPPGIKLSKIRNLSSNIAMALKAKSVRILTPIPGKSAVGVEVPAIQPETVCMKEMIQSSSYKNTSAAIPYCIGQTVSGRNEIIDLAEMPHLLFAGATGSGKSVAIHSLINSILLKHRPEAVQLFLIDPKRVELPVYRGIPHLAKDVICDPHEAVKTLSGLAKVMDRRYDKLAENNVSDIDSFNGLSHTEEKMPRLVIIIDELADLMALSKDKVERSVVRIAQMARAVGIHLVLATQRPSVDVITGLIKANLPARIAFNVLSGVDSRTILDTNGAEKLMGKGDLLYLPPNLPQPERIQGTFIQRDEIKGVVNYLRENVPPASYKPEIEKIQQKKKESQYEDQLYPEAVRIILKKNKASISMLQRKLRIGYNRAARIVDTMEENGVVGPEDGTKARKVLVGRDYLEKLN